MPNKNPNGLSCTKENMKIKITKNCECMYGSFKMPEPEDCSLKAGIILQGKATPVSNWEGKPLPATDLETKNGIYCAIPNDSFETVQ